MLVKGEDLNYLSQSVLEHYDVNPVNIQVIQSGGLKTVWKVETDKGFICLKRLNKTPEVALFSVEAQRYIHGRGGNVPGILTDKTGNPIVTFQDQLFVLYEWIDGGHLNFMRREHLKIAMEGLGRFHGFSMGYQPPEGSKISMKLSKWPDQYRSMINKLKEWKKQEEGIPQSSVNMYRQWVDPMIEVGERALTHLINSNYYEISNPESSVVVLCHQDYGPGNALSTPEGVVVLDLDGVTYELAARDLRKTILKSMEKMHKWDKALMDDILLWYETGRPMTDDERKMVYIDSLFPYSFFGKVKNQYLKGKPAKPSDIQELGRLELAKIEILEASLRGE
jgi:spore coat protein I